jgi:hypothetical protein
MGTRKNLEQNSARIKTVNASAKGLKASEETAVLCVHVGR